MKRIFLNKEEKDFIKSNPIVHIKTKDDKIILIEMTENIYFIVHLYFLLKEKIFQKKNIIGLWSGAVHRKKGFNGLISFIFNYTVTYFVRLKWINLYKRLGVHQVIDFNNNFKDNIFIRNSNFIKKNSKLKNKNDVSNIKLEGIKVGDLIYDHYLRFFGEVTFDIKDISTNKRILNIFEGSNDNLNNFYDKYKKRIDYYIPQTAVYLNGLAVRYFINKKIKTIGGMSDDSYVKKFSKKDCLESRKCENVRVNFEKLNNKRERIKLSERRLKEKFRGKINPELNYIKKSPYNKKNLFKIDKKIDVIIFLPDFSDAPHIYGKGVFNDFSEWIQETVEFLKSNNLSIAIKEHPNNWIYSSKVFKNKLKNKYKALTWLSKDISNLAIFNKKPIFGISPHGTVLHELAYHNIIPVASGPNPYMSYNFVFTPKSKKEYFVLITKAIQNKLNFKKNHKEKIAECYYMAFLHNGDYIKNHSRVVNLKNYLPSVGQSGIYEILKKFNEGLFK